MFNIGPEEIILILVVALLVFGPKRLPEVGRTIGRSLREFRQASAGVREEIRQGLQLDDAEAEPPVVHRAYPPSQNGGPAEPGQDGTA